MYIKTLILRIEFYDVCHKGKVLIFIYWLYFLQEIEYELSQLINFFRLQKDENTEFHNFLDILYHK